MVPDGKYTVGEDLPTGTYVASPTGSCYWAKYDFGGATIDNDLTQATRVEVVIDSSVYSFSSENCGGWTRDSSDEGLASAFPDSPEASLVLCSEYVLMSADEKVELAERYLRSLRHRDGKKGPSLNLSTTFGAELADLCSAVGEQPGDHKVGIVALTVYQSDDKYGR